MRRFALALVILLVTYSPAIGQVGDIAFDATPDGVNVHRAESSKQPVTALDIDDILGMPHGNLHTRAALMTSCMGAQWSLNLDVSEVTAHLTLRDARVTNGQRVPVVVDTIDCDDAESSAPVTCTVSQDSTESTAWNSGWTKTNTWSASATVGFRLGTSSNFAAVDAHTTVGWSGTTGESGGHTETHTVRNGFSATEQVSPGQDVEAVLTVDRATAQWHLAYDVTLEGAVKATCGVTGNGDRWNIDTLYDGRFQALHHRNGPACTFYAANGTTYSSCTGYPDASELRTTGVVHQVWTQDVHYDSSYRARVQFRDVNEQ